MRHFTSVLQQEILLNNVIFPIMTYPRVKKAMSVLEQNKKQQSESDVAVS